MEDGGSGCRRTVAITLHCIVSSSWYLRAEALPDEILLHCQQVLLFLVLPYPFFHLGGSILLRFALVL